MQKLTVPLSDAAEVDRDVSTAAEVVAAPPASPTMPVVQTLELPPGLTPKSIDWRSVPGDVPVGSRLSLVLENWKLVTSCYPLAIETASGYHAESVSTSRLSREVRSVADGDKLLKYSKTRQYK